MKNSQDSEPPDEQPDGHEGNPAITPKPSIPRRAVAGFLKRWRDPYRNRPNIAEWLTVILTVVIAGVGFLQWFVYKQQTRIMGSDNPQTQKLIEAASINACAAQKSAQAARDFADTAALINSGIGDAVKKLDAQAKAIDDSRKASERQSSKAFQSTVDNFRQEQRAWVGFSGFTVQPDPNNAGVVASAGHPPMGMNLAVAAILNSGKTPARNVRAVVGLGFKEPSHLLTRSDESWMTSALQNIEAGMVSPDPRSATFAQGNLKSQYPINSPTMGRFTVESVALGVIAPNIAVPFAHPTNWIAVGVHPEDVVIFGLVTYLDVVNITRTTKFCSYRAQVGETTLRVCPIYNDMQ